MTRPARRPKVRKPARTAARAVRPLRLLRRAAVEKPRDLAMTANHPANWTRPHVRAITIASGKGGVGKSNLAANLAVALGEIGARVLLLDADIAQANLDLLLGLNPRFDLQHVLLGDKSLEEIVMQGPRGVSLIPASSGVPELADLDDYRLECLIRGLGNLESNVDLILIDAASGTSRQVLTFCLAADDVIIVTTPEMPAFSDAYAMIKLLQQRGLAHPPRLVVNAVGTPDEAEEVAHRLRLVARRFLKFEPEMWGHVPFDPAVPRAVRRQEPVVTAFPRSAAAAAYRALAARLWEGCAGPESPQLPLIQKLEA